MALTTINGFSAEEATSKYVYENYFQSLIHINGKGCLDKYTISSDVRNVNKIDVMRLKAQFPLVRQLHASNVAATQNGGYLNKYNTPANGNMPQSENYSISIDLFYDRLIPIPAAQLLVNKLDFESIVQQEVIDAETLAINIVTVAKQIEGYFRNGDNFDKAKAHTKGSIVGTDLTQGELDKAVFHYYSDVANSSVKAFLKANAILSGGLPQIGAYSVPVEARQAFVTPLFQAELMGQYSSNASEAAAQINATGFMNPFTQTSTTRVDSKTGVCGLLNGVVITQLADIIMTTAYIYLGILGTGNDSDATLTQCRALLDKIGGFVVYGPATVRGIAVPPSVTVREDPYNAQMVNICPLMKMGVDVLHGASIKMIVDGGTSASPALWTRSTTAVLMNTLTFTPIEDDGTVARAAVSDFGFNDGTTK